MSVFMDAVWDGLITLDLDLDFRGVVGSALT
jgi:hypothetical protein